MFASNSTKVSLGEFIFALLISILGEITLIDDNEQRREVELFGHLEVTKLSGFGFPDCLYHSYLELYLEIMDTLLTYVDHIILLVVSIEKNCKKRPGYVIRVFVNSKALIYFIMQLFRQFLKCEFEPFLRLK